MSPARPPRIAEWILTRLIPRGSAAAIGDLNEEYAGRLAAGSPSRYWYWRQAISLIAAYRRPHVRRPAWSTAIDDCRFAARSIARSPGYSLTAIGVLALGIGATSAIFSFVDGVLLKPLPYPEPDRLVQLWEKNPDGFRNYISALNAVDWQRQSRSFAALATYSYNPATLSAGGEPLQVNASRVSASYFDMLGARAALGRTFAAGEDEAGRDAVLVLSHKLWQARFGGDASVIGRVVSVDRRPVTIVGVLPKDSPFDRGWTEAWLPLAFTAGERTRDYHWLRAIGRLAPGVTFEQAQAEMDAIGAGIARTYPAIKKDWGVLLDRLADQTVDDNLRRSLQVLLGAVGLLLLLGCANLANLALARGASRQREVLVRAALGASRGRIARQFLAESAGLGVAGGVAGIGLGYALMRGLSSLLPPLYLPREAAIAMDARVVLFAAGAAMVTALLFGAAPAWHASRVDLARTSRGSTRSATADRAAARLRHLLVAGEIAVACLLLAGAGLLGRSFLAMQRVEVARDPEKVLSAWLIAPGDRFGAPDEARSYYRELLTRARAVPGVAAAAWTTAPPLQGWSDGMPFRIAGTANQAGGGGFKRVSPEYFAVIGLPILRGRALSADDRAGTTPVIVINETLRRKYFPDRDPIGERLLIQQIVPGQRALGPEIAWQIVGIAANERVSDLSEEVTGGIYAPVEQAPSYGLAIVLRTTIAASAVVAPLREAVKQVDANQAVSEVSTISEAADAVIAPDRLRTALIAAFAAIALLLAAVGVFGVISYTVAQRTREIGIRAALGAGRARLLRQVLGQAALLAAIGVVVGTGAALVLGRFLSSLLVGVTPRDVPTLAGAALVLTATAILSAWIPARRAASVDPVTALRAE